MAKKPALGIAAAAVLLIVAASICVSNQTGDRGRERELTVGAIYPLTGPASSLGAEFRSGLELAVQKAFETHGIRATLRVEDGKAEPKTSIAAFQKLQNEGAVVVFTTVSGVSLALKPLAIQSKTLLFADAAHPAITVDGRPFVFRHNQTAGQEAKAILEHASATSGARQATVFVANDEYSAAVAKGLEQLNEVASSQARLELRTETFDPSAVDIRMALQRALNPTPDILIVSGIGKPLGNVIASARQSGFSGRIYATMGFAVTPDAQLAAGESAIGVWHTKISIDTSSPTFAQFATAFAERFGRQPRDFAVLAYNSATLFFEAHANASEPQTNESISDAIYRLASFRGTGETMTIGENGDILPAIEVVQHNR